MRKWGLDDPETVRALLDAALLQIAAARKKLALATHLCAALRTKVMGVRVLGVPPWNALLPVCLGFAAAIVTIGLTEKRIVFSRFCISEFA